LASWPFQREFDPVHTSKAVRDATPIISGICGECENKSMAYIYIYHLACKNTLCSMILISLMDMIINHRKMLSAHGALVKEPNIVKLT
jgi:hypothetical protein